MWKDFFYFSSAQRAGILVLLSLILLVGLIDILIPVFIRLLPEKEDTQFLSEIEAFKKSLVSIDSIHEAERLQKYPIYYNSSNRFANTIPDKPVVLFSFDPNELDSLGFISLGLKPHIASNILKYRRKGGVFKDQESLSRVYGISEEQYLSLFPYVKISKQQGARKDTTTQEFSNVVVVAQPQVELNTADTTELMQIKGIGRAYAYAIIKYRKQAGGFVHIGQLGEIYGMTQDNLEKIQPCCTVNRELIQKINVNTASIEKLKAHPYLNFYQAKQIYELRRKKGSLTGMADLNKLSEFDEVTLRKIADYLSFE